jgi:transposase-like protein
LVERGLRADRALLVLMDGAKALHRAMCSVFGRNALIQRRHDHKKRNVLRCAAAHKRLFVKRALTEAFHMMPRARSGFWRTWREVWRTAPGSSRVAEGVDDLLTVKQLRLGGSALERTLSTTNLIENLIGQLGHFSGRVPRRGQGLGERSGLHARPRPRGRWAGWCW